MRLIGRIERENLVFHLLYVVVDPRVQFGQVGK